ncbi:MAG: carboxymuconolactone decarboxylase family protein [Bilifractor sp.]|jgi:4-carboxymuconolactone decarboxylase
MSLTNNAKEYHDRMFPGHHAEFSGTDPEYIERFQNFAYDEVVNQEGAELPGRTRFMAILSVLMGSSSIDMFREMMPAALNFGVKPTEVREIVYQATAYLGIGRVYPFLKAMNEIFQERGISLPLEKQATVSTDPMERQQAGTDVQVEIFGEGMKDFWKKGHMNYWLADNCFGDYYTRGGLTLAEREMVTFCYIYAQGGCENQLRGHTNGNLRMGNDRDFLIRVVSTCVPFIGYPRSLNAVSVINEVADQFEKTEA